MLIVYILGPQEYHSSCKIAQMNAVHNDIPDVYQNRLLQPELVSGTRVKLITAVM